MTAPSPWWFSPGSKFSRVGGAHVSVPAWFQARVRLGHRAGHQWDRLAELKVIKVKVLVAQVVSDSLQPARLLCPWDSPCKNTGVGSSPGDLPDPGIEPMSLSSPVMPGKFFNTSATWEAQNL